MRRVLLYILVGAAYCTALHAAERKSWNRVRYIGGTIAVKASAYDWNTTVTATANPHSIVIAIAPAKLFTPAQTINIKPSQVISLSEGPSAWHHVAELPRAQLLQKPPTLFGLFENHGFFGIVYQADDGNRAAVLLESPYSRSILSALRALTNKPIEDLP
jgi:hypothetical protein